VALPPPGEGSRRHAGSHEQFESNNPDDLWDDPLSPTEADADFSAFGGSLEDEPKKSSGNVFDLAMMAEAAKKFDDEVRGTSTSGSVGVVESHDHAVNPKRPLASVGTTIRSGSGNDVNVFEDFDVPDAVSTDDDAIRPGTAAQTASSRLMQMIGVSASEDKVLDSDDVIQPQPESTSDSSNVFGVFGAPSIVPSNPWGAPMTSVGGVGGGLDLSLKLREVSQQPESQNDELEMRRRKQLEEEEKRRAALLAQQQAEQQAAKQPVVPNQQQAQARQQPEYSQVELILAERISTVLENCWGRADLMTILQTLHNDDSRVVPLLGSVDALRALIVRHPLRFALTKDPTFGSEMAALVMNNVQWQQHKAADELQRRQQEEHQKILAAKEAEARAKAEAQAQAQARLSEPVVITDAPWFYADPQGNIQVRIILFHTIVFLLKEAHVLSIYRVHSKRSRCASGLRLDTLRVICLSARIGMEVSGLYRHYSPIYLLHSNPPVLQKKRKQGLQRWKLEQEQRQKLVKLPREWQEQRQHKRLKLRK
jgi:hypothetical protein